MPEYFVHKDSIVRKIWGKSDTILFIFAGSGAEFALNRAVDWLYFTGRLPADPLGRLFSTVTYARKIVFSELTEANAAIDRINAIHSGIEKARGQVIPEWAYRDVLFLLIHYSIATFELLERKLSHDEKEEVFSVFYRLGKRMQLGGLPHNYDEWKIMRAAHLQNDLVKSKYTVDLYKQYKKHLGAFRYKVLKEGQLLVIPEIVRKYLGFKKYSLLYPALPLYKLSRFIRIDWLIKEVILPPKYKKEIRELDRSNEQ